MTDVTPNDAAPSQDTETAPEPNAGQQQDANERTFTQADLDRIVADRAKRAEQSARSKLLEDLGVDDPASLKAMLSEFTELKQAQMTEAEKAQAAADAYKAQAEAAEARLAQALEAQAASDRSRVIANAIAKGGGNDVDNLLILVNAKLGDDARAVFGEDNTPDDKKLAAFVKDVQTRFPAFFAPAGAGSPSNANGISPLSNEKAMQDMRNQIKKRHGM